MSNKPAKKSDSGKAWMRQRRDRAIRIAPEYHLIVSEGIKTEPQYFKLRGQAKTHWQYLKKLKNSQTDMSGMESISATSGLYLTRMIFRSTILIIRLISVKSVRLTIENIMRSGQMSV